MAGGGIGWHLRQTSLGLWDSSTGSRISEEFSQECPPGPSTSPLRAVSGAQPHRSPAELLGPGTAQQPNLASRPELSNPIWAGRGCVTAPLPGAAPNTSSQTKMLCPGQGGLCRGSERADLGLARFGPSARNLRNLKLPAQLPANPESSRVYQLLRK